MGCHGPAGAGIPVRYPAVSGQHASYTAKQLTDFKTGSPHQRRRHHGPDRVQDVRGRNQRGIRVHGRPALAVC
ncbi:MAG: hypothetical protein MZV65_21530 [Chromatiales bacterium]|nr:hypothetical protein [Chromatiales bacterium]